MVGAWWYRAVLIAMLNGCLVGRVCSEHDHVVGDVVVFYCCEAVVDLVECDVG